MSKSIFSRPVSKESHSRNGFDRSQVQNVNFSAGMLIPTFCEFVFGHSHARINQRSFIRTASVNKPAFPSLPMYTDYFFVPMHQLLSSFNAFRSQTNDKWSTKLDIMKSMPYFNQSTLATTLQTITDTIDSVGCLRQYGAIRLLDLLRYGYNYTMFNHTSADDNIVYDYGNLNPLKLAAYQKIYYDHYRNTAYEANDVQSYNLDNFVDSNGVGQLLNSVVLAKLLTLRYANYKKDFVNTVYPSLNFVDSAANPLLVSAGSVPLPASVVGVGTPNFSGSIYTPYVSGNFVSPSSAGAPYSSAYQSAFSLQNIRAALAYEKLVRVSSFAPQHVVDQFEARFGYRPKSSSLHESVRLGSFKNDIVIGEVTSTSDTDYAQLGSIGGKGIGSSDFDKVISYDVPEDGFIMGITYIAPPTTYDSDAIDSVNQQFLPEDWSLPEYENLGLQPLFLKNVSAGMSDSERAQELVTPAVHLQRINKILGYQPRDMQYKANISLNHGLFNSSAFLSSFVLHGRKSWFESSKENANNGVDYTYFKVDPSDLNDIFVNSQNLGNELDDHFFGNIVNSFAIVQDKPVFGFSFNL